MALAVAPQPCVTGILYYLSCALRHIDMRRTPALGDDPKNGS
jgi:hypothetical protein